jgi:hypothetical protein
MGWSNARGGPRMEVLGGGTLGGDLETYSKNGKVVS